MCSSKPNSPEIDLVSVAPRSLIREPAFEAAVEAVFGLRLGDLLLRHIELVLATAPDLDMFAVDERGVHRAPLGYFGIDFVPFGRVVHLVDFVVGEA